MSAVDVKDLQEVEGGNLTGLEINTVLLLHEPALPQKTIGSPGFENDRPIKLVCVRLFRGTQLANFLLPTSEIGPTVLPHLSVGGLGGREALCDFRGFALACAVDAEQTGEGGFHVEGYLSQDEGPAPVEPMLGSTGGPQIAALRGKFLHTLERVSSWKRSGVVTHIFMSCICSNMWRG